MSMVEKWKIKKGTLEYWDIFFNNLKKARKIKEFLVIDDIIFEVITNYNKKIRILCLFEYIFTEYELNKISEDIDLVSIGAIAKRPSKALLKEAEDRNLGITREKYLKYVLVNINPIKKANNIILEEEFKNEK